MSREIAEGVMLAISFLSVVASVAILVFVVNMGKSAPEEPKQTQHLHLHMEACDQKDRFGL